MDPRKPRGERDAVGETRSHWPSSGAAAELPTFRTATTAAMADGGDHELMARIVARDGAALAALYDRHNRLLFSVAHRMLRDRSDAEEVVQETLLVVWTRAGTYDRVLGSPVAWLVRITRNRAIDRFRAHRAKSRAEARVDWHAPPPSPESAVQRSESQRRVTGALRALSPEQRNLIQTAYFEGLSQSELAARFQLPLGTVKTRVRAGMKILREALDSASPRRRRTATSRVPHAERRRPPLSQRWRQGVP